MSEHARNNHRKALALYSPSKSRAIIMAIRQQVPMEKIRRALQGAPQLRSFLLHDVTPTGKQLGGGSYGEVVELQMPGLTGAGKKIYDMVVALAL